MEDPRPWIKAVGYMVPQAGPWILKSWIQDPPGNRILESGSSRALLQVTEGSTIKRIMSMCLLSFRHQLHLVAGKYAPICS
jgi:hypothetical protein